MMTSAIRVLYVDDEPDLLEIGRIFLELSGDFEVTTIMKGSDAIDLLDREKFDAIISDYQMPGMDGIEFLDEVRTRFGRIPFILFTGRGREEIVIQAINRGVDFYLQKGGDPGPQFAELSHKIRQATSRKKAEDSIRKSEDQYRHLVECSDEIIVVLQDGMLQLVNHRAAERTGYSEQELLSIPFPELVHPDDRAKVVERYQDRMKGEETPSQYTFRVVRKDGRTIWVEISVVAIVWEGRPATINFLIDITDRKWAEEMVIQTRRNYEAFFNTINEFLFVLDEQGRILHTNETVTRRLGYTKEEILGQSVLMVHPPERRDEAGCTVQGMLAGTMEHCPVPLMTKEGQLIPVETRVTIGEWDGRPVLFGVSTDISKLKRSEEKFSLAFHANASPMALATKTDGKFIEVNEAFLKMFGFFRDEVVGKNALDLGLFIPQDDRSNALRMLEESGTVRNLEITIRGKDGSIHHGLLSGDSINIGEVSCLLTTLVDITERKRAEGLLNDNYQFMKTLIQTIPIPVFIKNRDGKYTECNKAFEIFFGQTRDEIIGKTVYDVAPKEIADEYFRTDEELIHHPGTQHYEWRVVAKNGQTRDVIIDKATIMNSVSEATGIIGVMFDITERKLAEAELLLTTKKNANLANISRQDTLNKLTGILGYLDMLKSELNDPSLEEYFQTMATSAKQISVNIRSYEQISVNAPVWQDCHTLIDTAAKEAPLGMIRVKNDLPAGAEVFADPLIVKVFYNLMDNAVRYGGKCTTIRFSVDESEGDHVVVCEDDGDGVIACEKDKIFERGFGKNTGLGLALSHEILSITGITIRETGEPDKGARFEMAVPKGMWRIADVK